MQWKVLVPLCLLCLSGLASGDEDFDFTVKRKVVSLDTDSSTEQGETLPEKSVEEEESESQSEEADVESGTETKEDKEDEGDEEKEEEEEEEKKEMRRKMDNKRQDDQLLDAQSWARSSNGPNLIWLIKNTFLRLYTRNREMQVVNAHDWFRGLDPDDDLVIMVHKETKNPAYINDYFNTLSEALLNETNYNIIGVDWSSIVVPDSEEHHLATNMHHAKLLGVLLSFIFEKRLPAFFSNSLNTYYIGEGLGTIPPITFEQRYKKPFHYVYGLNPKKNLPDAMYRLSQDHGDVVALVITSDYPYTYAHKNLHPVPFDASHTLSPAYKIMAQVIKDCRRTATFCPSESHFRYGYCDALPHVPIWLTHTHTTDKFYISGKYYFYEFPHK